MVQRANIQTTITIPNRLDSDQRVLLADLAIKEIIKRTTIKRIDVRSRPFKKYSAGYADSFEGKLAGKKKGQVANLNLTGDMVFSIGLISHDKGQIIIGYETGDSLAGQVEGNQIGSYGKSTGNPAKARKFIGLPAKTVKILVAKVESATISRRLKEENSLINNILGRISGQDQDLREE